MKLNKIVFLRKVLLATALCTLTNAFSAAQTPALKDTVETVVAEETSTSDSFTYLSAEESILTKSDSLTLEKVEKRIKRHQKRDWETWKPNPKKALWMALVLPGAGQIYNRKYWKLPIVYGGFVGCTYAISWNNMMYKDYSQAYKDIMDDDPETQSYNQFLHLGSTITPENEDRYKALFKKRKDYYRRYRDLSIFILVGVYALSVIDAYVDASLSEFDISKDLSMRISPSVINDQQQKKGNPIKSSALGIQCSLNF